MDQQNEQQQPEPQLEQQAPAQPALSVAEIIDSGGQRQVLASDGILYPCAVDGIAKGDVGVIVAGAFVRSPPDDAATIEQPPAPPPPAGPDILDAAAQTADSSQEHPKPDEDVISAFAQFLPSEAQIAERRARLYAEGHAARFRLVPLFSLEDAIALPEVVTSNGPFVPLDSNDEREIVAFKDIDRRTMRVVLTHDGLAKLAIPA